MVAALFPDFDAAVNSIAAGRQAAVDALHEVLDESGRRHWALAFMHSRSRQLPVPRQRAGALYTWDAYHIENYLLEPELSARR